MVSTTLFKKMKASSYSSITECPELPEDLITRILLRIHVKSLLRFRLVSKTWYDFLKTPYFISMHQKFNLGTASQLLMYSSEESLKGRNLRKNHAFSFYSNDKSARVLSPKLPILADPDTNVVLAANSCNGIVCYYDLSPPRLFCSNLGTREFNISPSIFLSNPATREFRCLPLTPCQQETEQKFYRTGVAFGFDSTNIYDFKVLSLFSALTKEGIKQPSNKGLRAEMFTLSSNTWKQLRWGLDDSLRFSGSDGFFCANSFHFFAHRKGNSLESTIVCCDIHTERFKTMELPSIGDHQGYFHYLRVLKGLLSAICTFEFGDDIIFSARSLEIWVMKDYGVEESWTKLYKVWPPWGDHSPQCFWNEDDALLLAQWGASQLLSWDLNTHYGEDVKIDGYEEVWSQLVVYKETLVSIT